MSYPNALKMYDGHDNGIILGADVTSSPIPSINGGSCQFGVMVSPSRKHLTAKEWVARHAGIIEHFLGVYGVVLLRGFPVDFPIDFLEVSRRICGDLILNNGEHPELTNAIPGVYQPVHYAPEEKLLWHSENSFCLDWPSVILFGCVTPADVGGKTPFVDTSAVFSMIASRDRDALSKNGIIYERFHIEGLGRSWRDLYGTDEIGEAKRVALDRSEVLETLDDQTVRATFRRPAFETGYEGSQVWFNQILHWHPSCLPESIRGAFKFGASKLKLLRNCRLGNGAELSDEFANAVFNAHYKNEMKFSWRSGDIAIINNVRVAHGREAFKGVREHLVSVGKVASWSHSRDLLCYSLN